MTLEKKPFVKYSEEPKTKKDVFSVRVNEEERNMIDTSKLLLDIDMDGTCLKTLATIGFNVINTTFSPKILKYLTSAKRNRLSETIAFDEIIKKNVIQNWEKL